jgi:hypothetical protein
MKTKLMKTTVRGSSAALLVSVGVLLLFVAGIQGSGPKSSVAGFECSDATIRGTWGTHMQGTGPVPPPLGGGIQNLVGVVTRTYDGMGNFTQIDNIHGSVTGWVPNRPGSGTYQVNPDCTFATQFVPGPGAPVIEERGVIVELGNELHTATVTSMATMVSAHSQRIDRR